MIMMMNIYQYNVVMVMMIITLKVNIYNDEDYIDDPDNDDYGNERM